MAGPATSQEAIQAAGLDWDVEMLPLHIQAGNKTQALAHRFAIVRSDHLTASDDVPAL